MSRAYRFLGLVVVLSILAGSAGAADLKYRIRKRVCQMYDTCPTNDGSTPPIPPPSGDNAAPVLGDAIPAQGAVVDVAHSYTIPATAFSDSGDTLTWSLTRADGSALPAWLSFVPGTRTLSGTPGAGDVGLIALKVTATDTASQTASQTFGLTVSATGTAPVATYFVPLQADKGVDANANLYVFFDRTVKKGAGNIVIHKASDDSAVMTIPVTSGATTVDTGEWGGIAGFLAVNPTAGLAADTAYYVAMDAGVVLSVADNAPFAGISDKTGWTFTTQAVTPSGTVLGYTGANQTYTVPANVSSLRVKMWGAGGGGNYYLNNWYGVMTFISDHGGGGGYSEGAIAVTPGETLAIVVGGGGHYGQNGTPANCAGGWPDGGNGSCPSYSRPWAAGSGGGGRTAIMRGTTDLLTAGGGGGGGSGGGNGAAGGGTAGRNGPACCGGFGGSQTAAGASGTCGGSAGSGHNGGAADWMGGGGGGGWFGGGGSRDVGDCEKGGGGGSGYIGGAGVANARTLAGGVDPGEYTYYGDSIFHRMPGNPVDADRNYSVGLGGDGATSAAQGGNGQVIITPIVSSDTVAPTVSTRSPADGAANVAVDANLAITFSENVQIGIGDIEIRRSSDAQLLETINVADAGKVGISGAVATINPATTLAGGTGYYVTIASGAFTDMSDNPFAGISGTMAWNFTTVAAPVDPCAGSPAAGDVCADGTVYAGITPDGNVSMYVTRCDVGMSWNGSACTGTRLGRTWGTYGTTTGITNVNTGEANTTALAVYGDTEAAKYCNDLSMHGQTDWYLPAKAELNVIYLASVAVGGTFRSSFDLSGSYPSGAYWSSSENNDVYAWGQRFNDGFQYNYNKAINAFSVRCVRTDDAIPPTGSSFSPADGAANVAVDANLAITFSENVQIGIGDIEIRRLSDSQLLETINVADAGKVGIAGAVAAINPATGLANGTDYYVTVAPGAFTDMSDNPFAGISGSAAWNFRTVAAVDPCASNPVAGDVCADGTVYVGLSPDGNVPMYVTRCDAGMSWNGSACAGTRSGIPWNNETSAWTTTGATSTTTGEANTVLLAGLMDAGSPHYAAKYCQDMVGVHGHSDWYLPAKAELNVIYQASVSAGGTFRSSFDLGGLYPSGYYWSSSDDPIYYAWFQSLSDGYQDRNMKNNRHSVRCVRKGNAELGMTVQQGDPAAMNITGGSSPGSNVVFTITNAGELASGTMTVSLTGDTANFSKTADTCNGQVLAASASCSITVQPIATDNGSYTGVLQVAASPGGTVSRSLSGTASGFGPPPVGTVMPDGTVYAGLSPDGNVPMYATRCDAGMSWGGVACTGTRALRAWNKETFNWTSTGATDWDAGEANTTTLAGLLDAGSPYLAAVFCHDLVLHGQDDWYLPARNELNVLKVNASAIGGFDLTGGWPGGYYWSSSEYDPSRAYGDYFFGSSSNSMKSNRVSHRCVRR